MHLRSCRKLGLKNGHTTLQNSMKKCSDWLNVWALWWAVCCSVSSSPQQVNQWLLHNCEICCNCGFTFPKVLSFVPSCPHFIHMHLKLLNHKEWQANRLVRERQTTQTVAPQTTMQNTHKVVCYEIETEVHTSSNLAAIMLKAFTICDVEPITVTIRSANCASEMLILAQL